MTGFRLYENLKKAYETTTQNCNRFKKLIESIAWDSIFEADGETYFCLGGFTLTIENINPFAEEWKPCAMFADGSCINF